MSDILKDVKGIIAMASATAKRRGQVFKGSRTGTLDQVVIEIESLRAQLAAEKKRADKYKRQAEGQCDHCGKDQA